MCPQRLFKFVYLSDGQTFNPKLFARPSSYDTARVHPLELGVQFDCLPQARTLQSSPEDYVFCRVHPLGIFPLAVSALSSFV
jgi:hypothetical protein